jgi:hypothetical protein
MHARSSGSRGWPGLFGLALLGIWVLLAAGPTAAETFQRGNFDHTVTGFPLTGGHQRTPCESCHINGVFKGTPNQCLICHRAGSRMASTAKPPNHIPTNSNCDECHNNRVTWSGARFNHAATAPGSCSQCHNGATATGQSGSHVPSRSLACDSCHKSTSSWSVVRYDHLGIANGCGTCHSGTYGGVPGKSAAHVPSSPACESCHKTTTTWNNAKYDHLGIAGGCEGCHSGSYTGVVGRPADHFTNGFLGACYDCHKSTAHWLPLN